LRICKGLGKMEYNSLAKIFESLMLVAFGCAWPANILNTWRRKSSIGKSLAFLIIILCGYIFGITAKIVKGDINYVVFFYLLNFVLVASDLFLFFWFRRKENLEKSC
jgi:hypothetical protein